jgi:putative nucleotidyltransferase with HDIG domain
MSKFQLVLLGDDKENLRSQLVELGAQVTLCPYDADKILEPFQVEPLVIACLSPGGVMPEVEIAQSLRMNYPETPIYFITYTRENYNKRLLLKNGFTDTFFLPWEIPEFFRMLGSNLIHSSIPEMREYTQINAEDLSKESVLSFPIKVHLTANNRFVLFAQEDEKLSGNKLQRLAESRDPSLYIKNEDQGKFEKYVLESSGNPNLKMSNTARQRHLLEVYRELISEILLEDNAESTFEKSRELMNRVKELVKLILRDKNSSLRERIRQLNGKEHTFFQHHANVCAYAGYFANALSMPEAEEVALAGLFHDIGKMISPPPETDLAKWAQNHPLRSVELLKTKRMILPEGSLKAITQHHEAMDGSGFPKAIGGLKITAGAKILAIANRFDYLTSKRKDHPALTLDEAFEQIIKENTETGKIQLDIASVRKLQDAVGSIDDRQKKSVAN